MFVADPGHVLLEWDQSQGESRIVDGMSGDPKLLKLARMLPTEIDQHILNACKVFGVEYDELLKAYKAGDPEADEKRQLGKRVRHATNYGMGGKRMAEIAMVETESRLILDPDECEAWIASMLKATPGIERYQGWIRQQMIETGRLVSSWGRHVDFKGLRLTKEDYKAGYAWLPQHEVGVDTNRLAFVPLDDALVEGRWEGAKVVQQGHDSLVASTLPEHAYEIAKFVYDHGTVERTYPGASGPWTLAMPWGLKVGKNWKDMTEFKAFPSQKEFAKCLSQYV
jgi:DNA polymerase I-like protein with 3'-5' exonuclease and polymerase domains